MRPTLTALFLLLTLAAPAAAQQPAYGMGLVVPDDLAQRQRLSTARHARAGKTPLKATEAEWDSRTKGWVPAVRNQADCGSCWDFSAMRAAEIAAIKAGKSKAENTDWAEQSVLSCGRNGGCNGDWPETALEQIRGAGVADERDMPYQARATQCNAKIARPNTIDDYGYVGPEQGVANTQAIKDAIKKYGSVACAVAVDNAFAGYRSGIFQGTGYQGINHAIVLVGWNDAGGYWILSNSWGTSWGEQGYMRIRYGANLVGYGAMWASVDAPAPAPVPPGPTPPGPVPPAPAPNKGFTGTIATVQQYKDGVKVGEPVTIVGGPPGGDYDGHDLKAAGVSPALIGDVLELLRAVRSRDRAAILAAVTKILADLALSEPAVPVPQQMPAARVEPRATAGKP